MKDPTNLTGHWKGSYYQHDRPHPILLDLVQESDRLTGAMRDGETDRETSVFNMSVEAGLAPGADEQIVAQLHQAFPDAPESSIRYITHLPSESAVEGWVQGSQVYFLKTYQGSHFTGFRVGERMIGHQREGHAVHYGGRLSPDGTEIEGKWWIEANAGRGVARTEGSFVLRR
jgi:hypothetical protein